MNAHTHTHTCTHRDSHMHTCTQTVSSNFMSEPSRFMDCGTESELRSISVAIRIISALSLFNCSWLFVICFNSISGTAPQYLSNLLQPYTAARQLRSASDTWTFVTPPVNTKTFGERSFSYAGPSVWNNLPQTLCHSDSTSSFKAALKTHLFSNYF